MEQSEPNASVLSILNRKASRLPVGTITGLAAIYMLVYLVWERAGWGSTELRDLLGNVAFMPLNLTVVVLNGLAQRNRELDSARGCVPRRSGCWPSAPAWS